MKQLTTTGIILSRTDYGEADRILTLLTPDYGKLRLMARGVRKIKSKLAGGIALFSVSDITFVQGRGAIGTLVSARLRRHYGAITKDLDRTMLAYDLIKYIHRQTEDEAEASYFGVLEAVFAGLDDVSVPQALVRLWCHVQLLGLAGHMPGLALDAAGNRLVAEQQYAFDADHMAFVPAARGAFGARHIKFLRLAVQVANPGVLSQVQDAARVCEETSLLIETIRRGTAS